uniref:RNase H type-1 domain-containing protein n=1 Tax=Hordeum vulgare subsp. vulgare TaxID=112509 RepID=A0A8I6WJS1_HORVV
MEWSTIHTHQPRNTTPTLVARWNPPEQGWLKANSDGALAKAHNRGGGGVVLRDHEGAYRGGACYVFRDVSHPEMAELLACREAVQLAIQTGAPKVHVEVDSIAVAAMVNERAKNLSLAGPIVEEIKLLGRTLEGFKVSWIRRTGNKGAHLLAKEGISRNNSSFWPNDPLVVFFM